MKKRLTLSMVLVIVLMLIAVSAMAVALLSPKEVVEQIAVPIAQHNGQANYSYEELKELITALNESGNKLDEDSKIMHAFTAGHGYWEQDVIKEICIVAFGNEECWTREQEHWYGEMLVSAGVWEENDYILPAEGELQEDEAIALAIRIVKDTCNIELPAENSEVWSVQSALGFIRDENTGKDMPSWEVCFVPSSDESSEAHGYIVTFPRKGRAKKRIEHRSGSDKRKLSIANKRGRRPANNIWFYHKPIIAGKYYRLGTHIT